jgi:glycosyltransferase involved in cell wall biosynthesis
LLKKLSILIPAFNEEKTIHEVLIQLGKLQLINGVEKEILVIDDCSTDSTPDLVRQFIKTNPELNIRIHQQEKNLGKGAAIQKGILLTSGDFLIPQDSDLELDPKDINKLLQKLIDDQLDVVYGSRFSANKEIAKNPAYYANRFLTSLSNIFTGLKISDMETCYKLIRSDLAKGIKLKENRFGFEPEITAKLAKIKGIKFGEVPIKYNGRSYDEGKKIGWKDGLKAIFCIVKYAF